jgi:endonuclease G, mitochondrial
MLHIQIAPRHRRLALGVALQLLLLTGAHAGGLAGLVVEKAAEHAKERVGEFAKDRLKSGSAPVALPAGGSFAHCQTVFPRAQPIDVTKVDRQWRPTALCSNNFAVLYSALTKTPLVVAERLNREGLADARDEARTDEFYADPRLPGSARAELEDFRGSGLDRGHLAPAADQPDQVAMAQSFALSNMVPQDPVNNRKIWSKIEADTRAFARRAKGNVYVFSGPLFQGPPKTMGRGKVWIPTHLFKLVYDEASGRAWAHLLANTAEARIGPPMGYAQFVQQTGWQLLGNNPSAGPTR